MKKNNAIVVLCLALSRLASGTVALSPMPFSLAPTPTDSPSPSTSTPPFPTSRPSTSPFCCTPSKTKPSLSHSTTSTDPPTGKTIQAPMIRWSFLFPLLAVSAVAWTFRKSSRRCLCIIPTDSTIPEDIIVDRACNMEDDSVVGDRGTDVELVPVHTLRSHDWTELGPDPMKGINYVDFYSEAIADFVAMEDDVHDRKE